MNSKQNLRDRLLAQGEPPREKLVRYQQETQTMLAELDRRLTLEKWYMIGAWMFAVLFTTVCLLVIGFWGRVSPEVPVLALCFVLLISGGVEVVKHFVNRSRVELLKELKGLELQVRHLDERLSNLPK
jgi:hypothetical protein